MLFQLITFKIIGQGSCKKSTNGSVIDETLRTNKYNLQSRSNVNYSTEIFKNKNEITINIEDLENILPKSPPKENNPRNLEQNTATIDCRYDIEIP